MELTHKRINSAAATGLLYSLGLVLSNVLLLRWVLQALPKEEAGYWILAQTIGNFVLLFDLGFSPVLSRNIGLLLGASKSADLSIQIGTARRFIYVLAVAIFFILLSVGFWLAPNLQLPWWIFAFGASLNLAGGVNLAILNGLTFVALERWIRICGLFVLVCSTWLAIKLDSGLTGLAMAWAGHGIFVRIVAYLFANKKLPVPVGSFSQIALTELWKPSLKWSVTTLGALLILQSGAPILVTFHGASVLPSFEALAKISAALLTAGLLLATASAPSISHLYGQSRTQEAVRLVYRNQRVGLSMTLMAAIFIFWFGDRLIEAWLGPGIDPGALSRALYLSMSVLEVHHVIWASAVVAVGPVPFAGAAIISGVLTVGLGFLLVPAYGVAGMAFATFLAQLMTNNWYAPRFAFQLFQIQWKDYWHGAIRFVLASAAWSILVAMTIDYFAIERIWVLILLYSATVAPLLFWIVKRETTKV